ncbi:protein kinase domain-containing protein [Lysobacter brunescens]|uniref:Protein kinase n=1 Tax=Lysobacter brunescens TaxID=262323 RepID=A0ABW2YEU8_9GAMM
MKALPCTPADWPRFSALLDQCLDLPPEARAAWIDALDADDRRFAPTLRALLQDNARSAESGWLERPPAITAEPSGMAEGERIGPWRLLRPLGRGGMGEVWLASRDDGAYAREVALKLPHPHLLGGALRERFQRERDILATLVDPRIARFYDAGVAENGQPWLALEYIAGTPIDAHCDRYGLDVRERVRLVRDVAGAVQAAHARLIVHRDLKPANVMVTAQGETRLLDFGIAKLLGEESSDSSLTQWGGRAATPDYAAPEQLEGGVVTVATDVYALGIMLYELLTGTRPFPTRSRLGRMLDTRSEAPLASTRVEGPRRRAIAGDLDAILAKAMDPEAMQRYDNVAAFAEDLQRYLDSRPIRARRIGRWLRLRKFVQRHRQGVAVAALLALALGVGIAGVLWQAQRAAEEARRATAIKNFLIEVFSASDPRIASDAPRGNISARALLDASADRIEQRFADDPDLQIELLRTLADLYRQLGEDDRYRALQEKQLAKVRERYGRLHPNLLNGEVEAATIACVAADGPACDRALTTSDRLLREAGDKDPELRAHWWILRANRWQAQDGAEDRAQAAFERAIALFRSHAPRTRGHVTALQEYASFLTSRRGDHEAAIRTYREALTLANTLPDRNDAELQTLYGNLGLLHQQLGRFAEAGRAFAASADIAARTTGADFPTAWVPRSNAARTLHLAGDRDAAHREFSRVVPLLPKDGRHAIEAAAVREVYGERLSAEGRPELGTPHLQAAEAIYRRQSAHPFKWRLTLRYLGEAQAQAGRIDEAGRTLKRSLDDYLAHQADAEQPVMAIRESWGRWLLDRGRLDEAQAQFDTILAHAEDRPLAHVALAQGGLARVALARGDTSTALRHSAAALDTWARVTGFRDIRMGVVLQRVRADVLAATGDLAGAQRLEEAATEASRRFDHPDSPRTRARRLVSPAP